MGLGKDGIMRFPRTRKRFLGMTINNKIPRGYNYITKKQKRLIKLIIDGMPVRDACTKAGVSPNSYYRWRHYSKPFNEYYTKYGKRQLENVNQRLDAKFGRAVQIIEDSMENPDPYFKHDVAVKYLSGRGHYKKNVEGTQVHTGAVLHGVTGKVKAEIGMDKELVSAFVSALAGAAEGIKNPHKPKIISEKILKSLPEPKQDGVDTKVSKVIEAEVVRDSKTG